MFATLFLGAVLAVFLTLGVVRGDAESGLLQPLVVRPIGRTTMLLGALRRRRGALAPPTSSLVYLAAWAITRRDRPLVARPPARARPWRWPSAVAIIAALSLLASTLLSVTAQGIVVFMVFGAGLTAGLLAQIGHAINSDSLHTIGRAGQLGAALRGALRRRPARADLRHLGPDRRRPAARARSAAPRRPGPGLIAWAFVYMLGVLALAAAAFARRDL